MNFFTKLFGKTYSSVSPAKAKQILSSGGILVDVRTRAEWDDGHAPEAIHIPLDAVGRKDNALPLGTPIVTICRSGHRSAVAARILGAQGHSVFSVTGGLPAWKGNGNPVEPTSRKEATQ